MDLNPLPIVLEFRDEWPIAELYTHFIQTARDAPEHRHKRRTHRQRNLRTESIEAYFEQR